MSCKSPRRNNINFNFNYHIGNDILLSSVTEHPYLELTFTSKFSWKPHISTLKASRILGLIKRNLTHCHPILKELVYTSLVRPPLEYCSIVWNVHHKSNINIIEAIQKRAAKFVTNTYQRTESVSSIIKNLKLESLKSRQSHRHQQEAIPDTND